MAFQLEPDGGNGQKVTRAPVDFVHPIAGSAVKMVVVPLARDLVPGGLTGQFNGHKPSLVLEGFYISVNGGNAEPGYTLFRTVQDFFGAKRVSCGVEGISDRPPLSGVALHVLFHGLLRENQFSLYAQLYRGGGADSRVPS